MKNKSKLLKIIITLMVVIGFTFITCDNGTGAGGSGNNNGGSNQGGSNQGENNFIGNWRGPVRFAGFSSNSSINFTDTNFDLNIPFQGRYQGTYTFSGNTATLRTPSVNNFATVTISENTLSFSAYNSATGTFHWYGMDDDGILTINNHPANVDYFNIEVFDTVILPTTRTELFNIQFSGGRIASGSRSTEPFSPVELVTLRPIDGGVSIPVRFAGQGKYFVILGYSIVNSSPTSRFGVVDFTRGSATIDFTTLTSQNDLPEDSNES